jgi:hypothetical protein
MVNQTVEYYKGTTYGNITLTNLKNNPQFSPYSAAWADTTNTTIKIVEESAIDDALVTISGTDIVSIGATTCVFKKSSLATLDRGFYLIRIFPGNGTLIDELRAELKVK